MKEITIINTEKMGVDEFSTEITYFEFDGYEGCFTKTTIGNPDDCEIEYEATYITGYAAWNVTTDAVNTTFTNDVIDYSEFMEAFKHKFGVEIPTE